MTWMVEGRVTCFTRSRETARANACGLIRFNSPLSVHRLDMLLNRRLGFKESSTAASFLVVSFASFLTTVANSGRCSCVAVPKLVMIMGESSPSFCLVYTMALQPSVHRLGQVKSALVVSGCGSLPDTPPAGDFVLVLVVLVGELVHVQIVLIVL